MRRSREALLAGKHVFVEKPLALELEEARDLCALAARQRCVLIVGHLLQYHSAFLALKDLVRCGDLGVLQYVYSNRLNLGKIRREENILWSFAPHEISMILALVGEEPEFVSATSGVFLNHEVADVTVPISIFRAAPRCTRLCLGCIRSRSRSSSSWECKVLVYSQPIVWRDGKSRAKKSAAEPDSGGARRAVEDRVLCDRKEVANR